jgi:hypothetical protein
VEPPENLGRDGEKTSQQVQINIREAAIWRPILVVGLTPQGCGPEGAADEDMKIVHTLIRSSEGRNTRKILEGNQRLHSLSFDAFIRAASGKILELFGLSTGPLDHQAIDAIALPYPEGDGEFRL